MKKTFKIKTEWVLSGVVILFLVLVFAFYFWGISSVVGDFNRAFSASPSASSTTQFQSGAAEKILRARGILQ